MQGGKASLIGATVVRRNLKIDSCRDASREVSGQNCATLRNNYREHVEQILSAELVPDSIDLGISQHHTPFVDTDTLPSLTEVQLQRLLFKLATVSHIRLLDLSRNKMQKSAFVDVFGIISAQSCLQELRFNATAMTDESCIALSESLCSLSSLISLQLNGNLISNTSCLGLANALQAQISLRNLDLGNNSCIMDEGGVLLMGAISALTCLQSIHLTGTSLSCKACATVFKSLRHHRSLKSLFLNQSTRSVLRSDSWFKLGLPRVPDNILSDSNDWSSLLQYLQRGSVVPIFEMQMMIIGYQGANTTNLIKVLSRMQHFSTGQPSPGAGIETVGIRPPSELQWKLHFCESSEANFHYFLMQTVLTNSRGLYCLLWTACTENEFGAVTYLTLDQILLPLRKWLHVLAWNVPEAKILIIGSQCGVSLEKFASIKSQVEGAVREEIKRLNRSASKQAACTQSLYHSLLKQSSLNFANLISTIQSNLEVVGESSLSWSRYDLKQTQLALESKLTNSIFDACEFLLSQMAKVQKLSECLTVPRRIRRLAADQYLLLLELKMTRHRNQELHGKHDGQDPHEATNASELSLLNDRMYSFGSSDEFDSDFYNLMADVNAVCRDMPFVGEEVPYLWVEVIAALKDPGCVAIFGNSILSMELALSKTKCAVKQLRGHSPHADLGNVSDQELWECLEFCSSLGLVFVYEKHFLRDPKLLVELLAPIAHGVFESKFAALFMTSKACSLFENDILIHDLYENCMLDHRLLHCFKAWSIDNGVDAFAARSAVLSFFNKSFILQPMSHRPECSLVTVQTHPHDALSELASKSVISDFHAMYLFPVEHVTLIAAIHAAVRSLKPEGGVNLTIRFCNDHVYIAVASSYCIFTLQSLNSMAPSKLGSIKDYIASSTFSHALSISCNNDGLFAFAARCTDFVMSTGSFGSYYQCWIPYRHSNSEIHSVHEMHWLMIGSRFQMISNVNQMQNVSCHPEDAQNYLPMLSEILASNSEIVLPHTCRMLKELFPRQPPVFISHVYRGDGTGEFCLRLKDLLEKHLLCTVWMDKNEMAAGSAFTREMQRGICNACVFIICLTPLYLTRPNCLRELRWAMDICQENPSKKLFILPLHPAVTYTGLTFIIKAHRMGLPGHVFLPIDSSANASTLSRMDEVLGHSLSNNAVHLLNRLTGTQSCDIQTEFVKLEPWCSDLMGPDWEETSKEFSTSPTSQFACKSVTLVQLCSCLISQIRQAVSDDSRPSSLEVCRIMDNVDLDAVPPTLQAIFPSPNVPDVRRCFRRALCWLSEPEVVKLLLLGFNDELVVHCIRHGYAKRNDGFGFIAHISGVDFAAAQQMMRRDQRSTLTFAFFCFAAVLFMLDIPFRITEQKATVCVFSMVIASWWCIQSRKRSKS
jgi:hypothetical protein